MIDQYQNLSEWLTFTPPCSITSRGLTVPETTTLTLACEYTKPLYTTICDRPHLSIASVAAPLHLHACIRVVRVNVCGVCRSQEVRLNDGCMMNNLGRRTGAGRQKRQRPEKIACLQSFDGILVYWSNTTFTSEYNSIRVSSYDCGYQVYSFLCQDITETDRLVFMVIIYLFNYRLTDIDFVTHV